jgi:drug/metabolite transporter (DMT)-like permease
LDSTPPTPSPNPINHARMHLLMLLVVVCWASNIIAGKQALTGFSALALAQLRVLGSAVLFLIGALATGRLRGLRISTRKWQLLAVIAANGIAANQLTFIGGMARSTVAHTGLIVALGPVMVLAIAVTMRLEVLTSWKIAGMVIAFAGVGILTADKAGQGNGSHVIGDLILLVSTIVFALYIVLLKEVADEFDTLTLNTIIFAMGAVMMLPFCTRPVLVTNWRGIDLEAWWGLAFLIVFGSVLPYLLFAYVLTGLAASRAAAFNYLQPVIASALGIWILSEQINSKVVAGGSLILAGVYLTERERGEEDGRSPSVRDAV